MSCDSFKFEWQRAFMSSDLAPMTRLVLHTLSSVMDADGRNCYPGIQTISRMSGLCERAVRTHLNLAEAAGWIRRWARRENGEPLTGKAAQGWRHYQYIPIIPQNVRHEMPHLQENVRHHMPHVNTERAACGAENVRHVVPLTKSSDQSKNKTKESQDAAYAASPTAEAVRTHSRARKTPVPDNFVVSDEVKRWAMEKGYPEDRLADYLDVFKDKARAGDYRYANHEAAFKTCIREDWGNLRTQKGGGKITPLRGSTRAPTAVPEGGFIDFGHHREVTP